MLVSILVFSMLPVYQSMFLLEHIGELFSFHVPVPCSLGLLLVLSRNYQVTYRKAPASSKSRLLMPGQMQSMPPVQCKMCLQSRCTKLQVDGTPDCLKHGRVHHDDENCLLSSLSLVVCSRTVLLLSASTHQ